MQKNSRKTVRTADQIWRCQKWKIHYDQIKMLIFLLFLVESLYDDDEYCLCVMMISFSPASEKKMSEDTVQISWDYFKTKNTATVCSKKNSFSKIYESSIAKKYADFWNSGYWGFIVEAVCIAHNCMARVRPTSEQSAIAYDELYFMWIIAVFTVNG